ncbi:086c01a9-8a11-4959-8691-97440515b2ac-CDS [Sclerotinia trifoliorum]|uniref:086c01a9-8a11-4959-8691-97440515b2ac-CDS n=1 Tax=Sclerotinia trifoliorum TaxID=28548 RepID=A0A8H2VZ06_9HELO|nr:086c01a9-8a11-4959-8691-97440515b2ac-CDS [Sclerotinia trifoliorum]
MSISPTSLKYPFEKEHELHNGLHNPNEAQRLPGYPQILLQDTMELATFISKDLRTPILEKISPRLWWMSTQSSAHIGPLHHQGVKLRDIVISENPELHLIWYYDKIFIKPVPKYLLSFDFWHTYLISPTSPLGSEREIIKRSALGFLRTYRYLVQYESDFNIAIKRRLLPEATTWESFSRLVSDLRRIDDGDVTGRYAFGEIRLSRLNFYIKIILGKSTFHKVYGQYGAYFGRFYGPVLFILGIVSIILNALQLEMAVESLDSTRWQSVRDISRFTSVLVAAILCGIAFVLFLLLVLRIAAEWFYACRDRRRQRRKLDHVL